MPKNPSFASNDKGQKESSPDCSSGSTSLADRDSLSVHSNTNSKRESSPAVSFTLSEGQSNYDRGSGSDIATPPSDLNSPRKSTDSGDSFRGNSTSDMDQADHTKNFEKSLNKILTKCSIENAVDIPDGETKGDDSTLKPPKSERKKKSVPWYSVSKCTQLYKRERGQCYF